MTTPDFCPRYDILVEVTDVINFYKVDDINFNEIRIIPLTNRAKYWMLSMQKAGPRANCFFEPRFGESELYKLLYMDWDWFSIFAVRCDIKIIFYSKDEAKLLPLHSIEGKEYSADRTDPYPMT